MLKNEALSLSEYIDGVLNGGVSREYGTVLIKTNIALRQLINTYDAVCQDCHYRLHPDDPRDGTDNGGVICEQCAIKAIDEARAEYETREDALVN